MSRIGKHPVAVPAGVTVSIDGQRVAAEGKLGKLERTFMREVVITREDVGVRVAPRDDSLRARMMWGTARTLVANLVEGVSQGFTRRLEITGVGYRAQVQGNNLVLQLGYSHDVVYPMPEGIKITCPDLTHIVVSGANWMILPLFATKKCVQPPGRSAADPAGPAVGLLLANRFQGDCQLRLTV